MVPWEDGRDNPASYSVWANRAKVPPDGDTPPTSVDGTNALPWTDPKRQKTCSSKWIWDESLPRISG
jgi:hypothetical protein